MPKVSILIPVYNVEKYIDACLQSILKQSFTDFEAIIVIDGSEDSSANICEKYAKIDSRFKVIYQENAGLAGARNTCIEAASGDYFAFVDSDDFISEKYIENLYDIATDKDAQVVACGRNELFDSGKIITNYRLSFSNQILNSTSAIRALNCYSSFDMSMWGKLFSANLFSDIHFPVGKLSEDQFVCFKLLSKASRIYYISDCLYYYRRRQSSITNSSKVNEYPIEASFFQKKFLNQNYPSLKKVADTSCYFSYVAVVNAYIKRGRDVPTRLQYLFKHEIHKYLISILLNRDISIKKKVQALMFRFFYPLYKQIYKSSL